MPFSGQPSPQILPVPPPAKKGTSATKIVLMIGGILFLVFICLAVIGYIITPTPHPGPYIKPTPTGSFTPSWHEKPTETVKVPKGSYRYYYYSLKEGDSIKIAVLTNGPPIDLLIMDEANFNDYKASFTDGRTWYEWDSLKVIKTVYEFSVPADDTYYVVLDNSPMPDGGADSGKDVSVQVTISNYY
jgi:hypothetical protein